VLNGAPEPLQPTDAGKVEPARSKQANDEKKIEITKQREVA
jgi:hypothetical protein